VVKCLFRTSVHFKLGYFLLSGAGSSLNILDTSPLSVRFISVFLSLGLFNSLIVHFQEHQFLILMKSSLSIFYTSDHTFSVMSQKSLHNSKITRINWMPVAHAYNPSYSGRRD
jgi:hypothetical protein